MPDGTTPAPEDLLGPEAPALLTLPELARVLGLSLASVRTAAADGRLYGLPLVQAVPGGTRRVPTAAVRALIESWAETPTNPNNPQQKRRRTS